MAVAGQGLGPPVATAGDLDDAVRGGVPLLEASRFPQTQLGRGIVELIIQEGSLIGLMPFITLSGEAYVARHERTLPKVDFRKVNQGYQRDHATFDKSTWGVTILGGEVYVDNFIIRTRPGDGDVKARQFAQKAKAAALTFDWYAIHGDGTDDSFRGLNWMVANGWGQSIDLGGAIDPVDIFNKLDEMIDLCRVKTPDCFVMNRSARRWITWAARNFPGSGAGFTLLDVGFDNLGRQVMAYQGIPFVIMGDGPDGAPILPVTETAGGDAMTGGAATSIYLCAFGDEENIFGILGAGGTMDVQDFGETEAAPGHMGRIEFYPGMVNLSPYALVRGFNLAAPA
jgi:hypothetical protein